MSNKIVKYLFFLLKIWNLFFLKMRQCEASEMLMSFFCWKSKTSPCFLLDVAKPCNATGDQTFRLCWNRDGKGWQNLLTEKTYYPCATVLTCGGPRCELWIKMKGVFWPPHRGLERWLDFFSVQFLQGEKQITISIKVYTLSTWIDSPASFRVSFQLHAVLAGLTEMDDVAVVLALALKLGLKSVPWMVPAYFSYWNPEHKHECSCQKFSP